MRKQVGSLLETQCDDALSNLPVKLMRIDETP